MKIFTDYWYFFRKNMIILKSLGDAKLLRRQMTFQQLSVILGKLKTHKDSSNRNLVGPSPYTLYFS